MKCLITLFGIALTSVLILVIVGTIKIIRSGTSGSAPAPSSGRSRPLKTNDDQQRRLKPRSSDPPSENAKRNHHQ